MISKAVGRGLVASKSMAASIDRSFETRPKRSAQKIGQNGVFILNQPLTKQSILKIAFVSHKPNTLLLPRRRTQNAGKLAKFERGENWKNLSLHQRNEIKSRLPATTAATAGWMPMGHLAKCSVTRTFFPALENQDVTFSRCPIQTTY